ncbi:ArsR/SmtB family transcription factor [Edaphobacter albus]|uniref:ArsR/SmtB family transcription factor n=1 Tax=Edaphobacter sp. 4G125 TaxID=2763071 RepID=UPI001647A14C|nr:metalloregulator ArsR/SmtB family transcription factor [Edaphobacter sp. 4G125]QNI35883.1 helix-turn-helix transcriptional regulator [Edaphobacter sp. 4G125]
MPSINVPLISIALADPTRFGILRSISSCEMISSHALCEMFGVTPATVSHHLQQLRLASLVVSSRDGRWRRHKVNREVLGAYVSALSKLALVHTEAHEDSASV